MRLLLMILLFPAISWAANTGKIIYPVSSSKIDSTLVQFKDKSIDPGFDLEQVQVGENSPEGSAIFTVGRQSYMMYWVDINNDRKKECVIIYIRGGTLNTSGIAKVFSHDLKPIDFAKLVSKNLYADDSGDLSKFHLFLAGPAIVSRNGNTYVRFFDNKPEDRFFEYIWKKESFRLINTLSRNTF